MSQLQETLHNLTNHLRYKVLTDRGRKYMVYMLYTNARYGAAYQDGQTDSLTLGRKLTPILTL